MLFLLFSTLAMFLQPAHSVENWPSLSYQRVTGVRSQRDISANVSINQLSLTGVRLSTVLLDEQGYTNESMSSVRTLLDIGVQTLVIDLYWNTGLRKFQLCPVAIPSNYTAMNNTYTFTDDSRMYTCESSLEVDDLMVQISDFITDSDTNLSANLIVLLLNLHELQDDYSYPDELIGDSNDTLTSVLNNSLSSSIYGPANLNYDRSHNLTLSTEAIPDEGFPTLNTVLFDEKKRVVATIWRNELSDGSDYDVTDDYGLIFANMNASYSSFSNKSSLTSETDFISESSKSWRFAYDSDIDSFSNASLHESTIYGYSPFINSKLSNVSEVSTLINGSLWSWLTNEPLTASEAKRLSTGTNSQKTQVAYQCASITPDGWSVSNCYEEKYVVCRKNGKAFEWELAEDLQTYFHASNACDDIEHEEEDDDKTNSKNNTYQFSVPKTALEQKSLINYLDSVSSNYSYWIDMNSIAITDCWVTGGPNANCPYEKVESERNFVQMITPASVFSFLIFCCILLSRLKRIPVHDNRKHWKRVVNHYKDNDYEGVPS